MENQIDIGTGIYSVPEAAKILNIGTQKLGQWVRRYWELEFLNDYPKNKIEYTFGEGRERIFNFHTLIEMITVSRLRELGVSFKKIKKAHEIAAQIYQTPFPFAVEGFMTDKKEVIHNHDEITSIILDEKKQLAFRELIEPFCEKIDFEKTSKLAKRFWPLGKDHEVIVDPNHRFGEPVVKDTNISTSMIFHLYEAGETVFFIADEYKITEKAVKDAIEFHKRAA